MNDSLIARLVAEEADSCGGKVRYASKKLAVTSKNRAMSRRRHRPKFLRAYPCPDCRGWHLTHQNNSDDYCLHR